MSNFSKLLKVDVRNYVKDRNGYLYLPWMRAVALAGHPDYDLVMHKVDGVDSPIRRVFGGCVVDVDMRLPDDQMQRVSLPILNNRMQPVPWGNATSRDVNDTINRLVAKGIAMTHGLGLSLWSENHRGDGAGFVKELGVSPNLERLSEVKPLASLKEFKDRQGRTIKPPQPYLGWETALAAARLVDDGFRFEVLEYEGVTEDGELAALPAVRVPGKGWMVGVRIHWNKRTQTFMLPIMGIADVVTQRGTKAMEHQPIDNPAANQWHAATMRCLAKAIAVCTGYGISLYAGEFDALSFDDDEQCDASESSEQAEVGTQQRGHTAPEQRYPVQRSQSQRHEPQQTRREPSRVSNERAEATPGGNSNRRQSSNDPRIDRIKMIRDLIFKNGLDEKTFTTSIRSSLEDASPGALVWIQKRIERDAGQNTQAGFPQSVQ